MDTLRKEFAIGQCQPQGGVGNQPYTEQREEECDWHQHKQWPAPMQALRSEWHKKHSEYVWLCIVDTPLAMTHTLTCSVAVVAD